MKLSIITINLNNKDALQKTIDSVIFQTFTDYEFIIIDGGSKDGSVDIIKNYADRVTYWVSEQDKGIYNAMNKGIKQAKGEYCYFLNSGDLLSEKDSLLKIFEDDPHESFICGDFITDHKGIAKNESPYRERDWNYALYDIYTGDLCHQAFFIKTAMFAKYGAYDESLKITADWKLFLLAIGINKESVLYKEIYIVIYNMEGLSSAIGGQIIKKERKLICKQYLSNYIINKFDRLHFLENNAYIIDCVHSKKWFYYTFHAFRKIMRNIGLLKM